MNFLPFKVFFYFIFLFSSPAINAQLADDLVGVWLTGKADGHVKIENLGGKYYGKIVWLKEPIDSTTGKMQLDKNNSEKSLRYYPIKGLRILKDFEFIEKGVWENGTIYDPDNGKTYSCNITMKNKNSINIRGFIGISLFGRTDVWTRVIEKGKP
jgi:uncharacterized protein (DUF2147 family)